MKRSSILLLLLALLAVAGFYGYKKLYRNVKPLTDVTAAVTITADSLIARFERDSAAANRQYLGKIIAVQGNVKTVEGDESARTVILGNTASPSSVRCSMDTTAQVQWSTIQQGTAITVKGACTGYNADEMGLGADVVLNRCVITIKE